MAHRKANDGEAAQAILGIDCEKEKSTSHTAQVQYIHLLLNSKRFIFYLISYISSEYRA